jgi:hypothetical protein
MSAAARAAIWRFTSESLLDGRSMLGPGRKLEHLPRPRRSPPAAGTIGVQFEAIERSGEV